MTSTVAGSRNADLRAAAQKGTPGAHAVVTRARPRWSRSRHGRGIDARYGSAFVTDPQWKHPAWRTALFGATSLVLARQRLSVSVAARPTLHAPIVLNPVAQSPLMTARRRLCLWLIWLHLLRRMSRIATAQTIARQPFLWRSQRWGTVHLAHRASAFPLLVALRTHIHKRLHEGSSTLRAPCMQSCSRSAGCAVRSDRRRQRSRERSTAAVWGRTHSPSDVVRGWGCRIAFLRSSTWCLAPRCALQTNTTAWIS